ncbi:MAG: hypothetical protein Q8S54_05085 [Bacteroidota bacterium]|nr:hypothetical protein [Odoribacter sp.]MDP3642550.1 hypothetical protein [Bacteroidota bacterium]
MKKKILGLIGAIAIIALIVFNVQLTANVNSESLTLSSFVMKAFAVVGDSCPGGSCTYSTYFNGKETSKCTACCPVGGTPQCDTFGCTCN